MGPSRANPLTGEILDADIIFDASMVRFWRQDAQAFQGGSRPASLIRAARQGWGLAAPLPGLPAQAAGWADLPRSEQARLRARLLASRHGACQCGAHMKYELGMAAMTLAARGQLKPGEKVSEDLVNQAIKAVVMHEVGHTLGLRHNFKASAMLKNEELHDTAITRKRGLLGSVMDYAPINLAPKGVKQGDYFTTTLGPYDYWAIEYAYRPLPAGEEGAKKLKEIARCCTAPGHDYATDEDMFASADPLVNAWDLGSDPVQFAQDRILLAEELLQGLAERVVEKGENYQRARQAFDVLLMQYGNAAHLVAGQVGGAYLHRDHRDDPDARDPFVPVPAGRQRAALKFLQEHLLSDRPFRFPPKLLRRLGADRWSHWGNELAALEPVEYPVHERVLAVQRVVLEQLFDPAVLARVQDNALKTEKERPLTLAEVFRSLTEGVWGEPSPGEGKDGHPRCHSTVLRRNLQREHLKHLSRLVLGKREGGGFLILFGPAPVPMPPDARSLARLHLREIGKRIDTALADKHAAADDLTRAHLEECRERITKVLGASVQVNEP
jgi:hypothetical protein